MQNLRGRPRGQDAVLKIPACATRRLLLGNGKNSKYKFLPILYTEFCKDFKECAFCFPWCWTSSDPGAKYKLKNGGYLQRERMACLESGTRAGHSLNTTLQTEKRDKKCSNFLKSDPTKIPLSSSCYPLQNKASAGYSFCAGCQTVTALLNDSSSRAGQI